MNKYTLHEVEDGNGWTATGEYNSGQILFVKCSENAAIIMVSESPKCEFLRIKQGIKNDLELLDIESDLGEAMIYALVFKYLPNELSYKEAYYFCAFIGTKLGRKYLLSDYKNTGYDNHDKAPFILEDVNHTTVINHFIKEEVIKLVDIYGCEAFDKLNFLTKLITTKRSVIEPECESIINIIADLVKKLERVPYKKEVREIWLNERTNRSERQFSRNLKSLGFEWLPIAPKGKNTF